MRFKFLLLAAVAALPAFLSAEVPRSSFMLLGGAGGYKYYIQPGPADVAMYDFTLRTFAVPANDPIKPLADKELISPMEVKAKSQSAKLLFEKFFLDSGSLGMTLGLSYGAVTETCSANCGDMLTLLVLNRLSSAGLGSSYLGLMMLPSLMTKPSVRYVHQTFDFGLNYHFLPGGSVDPYIGLNIGAGLCSVPGSDAIMCTATKYGGRLGLRFNFTDSFFMMLQGEADELQMTATSAYATGYSKIPSSDKHAMIGVGFNL